MPDVIQPLLKAVHFAAAKHRDQRRKNAEASPYVNHPIEVAETLARVGAVVEVAVLQAALLHDTLEDTHTTADEIEAEFGAAVRALVEEVTDDKSLEKPVRKQRQIAGASALSPGAKQIRIADKISNIRGIVTEPPRGWSMQRRQAYMEWTEQVVAGCRGVNAALEQEYDRRLAAGRLELKAG